MEPSASQRMKKYGYFVLVAFLLGYAGYFLLKNPENLVRFTSLSIPEIAGLLWLTLMIFAGLGMQLALALDPYGIRLSYHESFQLSISNTFLNYLPVKPGVVAKGIYLKTNHNLSMGNYMAALSGSQILWLLVSSLAGVGAGVVWMVGDSDVYGPGVRLLMLMMAASFSMSVIVFLYSDKVGSICSKGFIGRKFKTFFESFRLWKFEGGFVGKYLLVSVFVFLLFSSKIWLSFYLAGLDITILSALFMQSCLAIGFAFSIVPGNLGLREGALVSLAVILGMQAETALLAAIIDRISSLIPAVVLGPYYVHRLAVTTPKV